MKYKGICFFLSSIFVLTGVLGCGKFNPSQPKNPPVQEVVKKNIEQPVKGTLIAKVGTVNITLEDLNQEIDAINSDPETKPEDKITTKDKKNEYLKKVMVPRALFYQAALDKGLDKDEDVERVVEKIKMGLLTKKFADQERNNLAVDQKKIDQTYEDNKEGFKDPDQLNILEIAVPTEEEAKQVSILILQGTLFSDLAKERSQAKSAANGGDLGKVTLEDVQSGKVSKKVYDEAERLSVGQTSNYFKGDDGKYYIVKLANKVVGKNWPVDEAKNRIKQAYLYEEAQKREKELLGNLSRQYETKYYSEEIK